MSPGIGFGEFGEDHVRFALIENKHRTRQAIRDMLRNDGATTAAIGSGEKRLDARMR